MIQQNIGQTIGRYKIINLLGEGGMGAVYKAFDVTLQRDVALKVMHAQFAHQANFQERFLQEARTAARLDPPGIVQVHDFGAAEGQLYIVMEFIPGDNLGQILRSLRTTNHWILLREGTGIVRQVALALDYAHKHGVLHRDIKPDNIMLKPEPEHDLPYRPVITDLGLAKLVEGGIMTQDGTSMGTPAYMSPEQALGQPTDARSDVYSLGILLYELATARLPFPAHNLSEAIHYHTQVAPPPPRSIRPDIPEKLEEVILKTLQKDPASRYPSAGDLARALEGINLNTTQESDQKTSLGEAVSLITQYQKSLVEPRGPSILKEFDTPADLNRDTIQVLSQGKTSLSIPVKPGGMVIGRGDDCDIHLDDVKVSRNHARIEFDGSTYYIIDLDSTNGTFIENTRLLPGVREPWPPEKAIHISSYWLRLVRAQPQGADRQPAVQTTVDGAAASSPSAARVETRAQAASTQSPGTIRLETDHFSVDPGSAITVPVSLTNLGTLVDHYTIQVSGIPDAWLESPSPRIDLLPGESQMVSLTIRPPRNPSARAGSYTVQLNAAGENAARASASARGGQAFTLVVNPFYKFTSELHPERIRSGRIARIILQNQGNTLDTFNLKWQDRADELTFRPPQVQVQAPEGRQNEVVFSARPRQTRWIGGEQTHPFTIQIDSASGESKSHAAELVSRGLVPAWVLPVLFGLCVVLAGTAWLIYSNIISPRKAQAAQTPPAVLVTGPTQTTNGAAIPGTPVPPAPTVFTPSQTAAASMTAKPVLALSIKIIHPVASDNPATKMVPFQVQAFDPAAGTADGAGIASVDMRILDGKGNVVHQHTESKAAYCAFGGGQPDCSTWVFADHGYRWDKGQKITTGTYTLQAVVHAVDGRSSQVETKITIQPLRRIVFISEQAGGRDIFNIYEDASDLKQITTNMNVDCCLSWSPNGLELAFVSKHTGSLDIELISADGSKIKSLTQNSGNNSSPVWSPDGKRIAFLSSRGDGQTNQVFVMNADGSKQTALTNSPGNKGALDWSPDGQKLAYAADMGNGDWNIFTIKRDGSENTQLTNDPAFDGAPAWSPDGKHIAFISSRNAKTFMPFLMNSDGSGQNLLVNAIATGILARWLPDGKRIIFYAQGNNANSRSLDTVNADGSNLAPVTPPGIDPGAFSWSAEGDSLAISSGYDILLLKLDGSTQTRLTNSPNIIDDDPVWQPE